MRRSFSSPSSRCCGAMSRPFDVPPAAVAQIHARGRMESVRPAEADAHAEAALDSRACCDARRASRRCCDGSYPRCRCCLQSEMEGRLHGEVVGSLEFFLEEERWARDSRQNWSPPALDMEIDPEPGDPIREPGERATAISSSSPDLGALWTIPWPEATVLLLGIVLEHHRESGCALSPRQVLKHEVEPAEEMGYPPMFASEPSSTSSRRPSRRRTVRATRA